MRELTNQGKEWIDLVTIVVVCGSLFEKLFYFLGYSGLLYYAVGGVLSVAIAIAYNELKGV